MPSYLIALAVGDLQGRDIGPRSRVYGEPSVVDKAAWEFADTEAFVATGERLMGPYVWGRYDVLVLPPSFPYGGMENPVVTFATPTLLAGDRSLVDVIAHEASHSWTGNLVTNGLWNSFWLNEGWTMYCQREILSAMRGGGEKGEAAFQFDAGAGEVAMNESIGMFLERGQDEFTKLVPDLTGVDPDDAFSSVPYEKGFYLLYHLRSLVGKERFACFAHDYIQTFKFRSITAEDFKQYCLAYFAEGRFALPRIGHRGPVPLHDGNTDAFDPADIPALSAAPVGGVPPAGVGAEAAAAAAAEGIDLATAVDWDTWFFGVGAPPVKNTYDSSERVAVNAHAEDWVRDPENALAVALEGELTAQWGSAQWIAFVDRLVEVTADLTVPSAAADGAPVQACMDPDTLSALDTVYALSKTGNAEVKLGWSLLCIRSGMMDFMDSILAFLTGQGRMKYVRPIFRELLKTTFGRPLALKVYAEYGLNYHPICYKMLGVDIEKESAKEPRDPSAMPKAAALPSAGPLHRQPKPVVPGPEDEVILDDTDVVYLDEQEQIEADQEQRELERALTELIDGAKKAVASEEKEAAQADEEEEEEEEKEDEDDEEEIPDGEDEDEEGDDEKEDGEDDEDDGDDEDEEEIDEDEEDEEEEVKVSSLRFGQKRGAAKTKAKRSAVTAPAAPSARALVAKEDLLRMAALGKAGAKMSVAAREVLTARDGPLEYRATLVVGGYADDADEEEEGAASASFAQRFMEAQLSGKVVAVTSSVAAIAIIAAAAIGVAKYFRSG
jgi:hypothetical protein